MAEWVMIVDDDPVVRHLLGTVISSSGYEVESIETGGECLELLQSKLAANEPPIAIFLDYFLEDTSGTEVLGKIRALTPDMKLPVVLLSAKTRDEMLDDESEHQPDYYLQKPFKADVVLSIIETAKKEATT